MPVLHGVLKGSALPSPSHLDVYIFYIIIILYNISLRFRTCTLRVCTLSETLATQPIYQFTYICGICHFTLFGAGPYQKHEEAATLHCWYFSSCSSLQTPVCQQVTPTYKRETLEEVFKKGICELTPGVFVN